MPCARPDVFFSEPALDESPTIKRYPSPKTYKTRGTQGVERALEDLMQGLKVAAVPRAEPPSAWSESERESGRDGGRGWFARSKTPAEPRRSGSIRNLATNLRSKSSLSLRGKPRDTPAELGTLRSAHSSTWSFASGPATLAKPPLPAPSKPSKVPGSLKIGLMQRLKRSRGPIPEAFMANNIPQPQGPTTKPVVLSSHDPLAPLPPSSYTSHSRLTLRRQGTLRPETPAADPVSISVANDNNGAESHSLYAADTRTLPTPTFGPTMPVSLRTVVPGGQLGQSKIPRTLTATATPTLSWAANKGTSGRFTRPMSDDRRSAAFMTPSPQRPQVISRSSEPITPTKRSPSLSASSLKQRSLTLLSKSPILPKSPKSPKSPTFPSHSLLTSTSSFPSFGLSPTLPTFTLPLRRRSKLPRLSIITSDMLHTPAPPASASPLHTPTPLASALPHLSPMMPCNRPLSKAEAILGVRLNSISLDGRVSPNSGESSDDEIVSFTTPKGARRSELFVSSLGSPAPSTSPSRWLTSHNQAPTPDLSFESLSELSDAATTHPTTPPHSPQPELSGRATRAAVIAAAADPFKPRRLLHNLGARRKSRSRTTQAREEWAPPVPPLPVEYGSSPILAAGELSPEVPIPIAPTHALHRSSVYSPRASAAGEAGGLSDVITRNFRPVNSLPTPPPPRRWRQSTQIAAPAPVPIAPEARLPPHAERSRWPPRWEDEFNPDHEVAPAALMPSNASVHTFGTSAASYRSRASNASSFFDFSRMDMDDE
ncbi:hypothetical protein CspeluHIS016_0105050 [Cutaneotrichosporon spelunceum]|uniref:Uncharacterized protein n=1 Tax=Cutaneotrichosporon spelunceum TaxID=1672016 RepID=A0AAD3Y9Q4_9TREE|nr:hypothetical protein CspeluHIS016_0105050 [Cutaneotrichosporon spelunceum]